MGRRRSYEPLAVFMGPHHVGDLVRESSGAISFAYTESWLASDFRLPVSLSLPLRSDRHIGRPVIAFFENLLPDNDDIRRRVAERIGAEGTDAYSLLAKIGRDCVGALQIRPKGALPDQTPTVSGVALSDAAIEARLKDLKHTPLGMQRDHDFRLSLAGAQEKTALLHMNGQWFEPTGVTPTTHILKPSIGMLPNGLDMSTSVENEHYCLTLLAHFGLPTATTQIIPFGGTKTLVVTRFDRTWTPDGRLVRLPQEDCCQALSVPPTQKYQCDGGPGMIDIIRLLQGSDEPQRDQTNFFKANILFWLMGATDGHAKNFSIVLAPGGRFTLAPIYDVLTVQPALDARQLQRKDMRYAMSVGNSGHYRADKIHLRHFIETGLTAGLSKNLIARIIDDIRDHHIRALDATRSAMGAGFPEQLHTSVVRAMTSRLSRADHDSDDA